ncbi:MAG: hypothetical protein M3680_10640 [Myxococcota bacterium]|nr:hypothetical protein [Myxococcota bacterium]
MSRKGLLAVGGVAVIGALVALWVLVLRDQPEDHAAGDIATTAPGGSAVRDPGVTPERGPSLPVVTQVDRNTNSPSALPPDEYVIDGKRVRDHRNPEDRKPIDVPPNVHPPDSRKVTPALTGAFTDQVLAIMRECGKAVPREALGTKPRMEGQIVIAIKDHQATVTSSTIQLRDVTGAAVDPVRQCIEQKSVGLGAAAPDERDLESYSINLTFAFP